MVFVTVVVLRVSSQAKEAELESLRRFYEDKLSEMKSRVSALESERQTILSDLKSTGSRKCFFPVSA